MNISRRFKKRVGYFLFKLSTTPFPLVVDRFYKKKDLFFILGMGRSGTRLLAELLNKSDNGLVFHEPLRRDFEEIVEKNDDYIHERKKMIFRKIRKEDFDIYGEVNSNLRYHAGAIAEQLPEVTLIHNVRDGRDVVRSVMSRSHYTGDGIGHHSLAPEPDDPLSASWDDLTRFEKVCWLWKDANDKIEKHCDHVIQYERWTADYRYFKAQILDVLGLDFDRDLWFSFMNIPNNETVQHAIPHWRDWDDKKVRSFNRICGEQLRRYGYRWE